MKIENIKQLFENTVPQVTLKEASEDTANNTSLIDSEELVFNYDSLKGAIKTTDTVYFKEDKIVFVEFKNGNIKTIDFRLKATESMMVFMKHLKTKSSITIDFPNNYFEIHYVYNDNTATPTQLSEYSKIVRLLKNEYQGTYSQLQLVKASEFKI